MESTNRGQHWINRVTLSAECPTVRAARWQHTSGAREPAASETRGSTGGLTACTSGGTASTRGRSQICRRPRTGSKLARSAHTSWHNRPDWTISTHARPRKAKHNADAHLLYLGWRVAQWQTPTEISRSPRVSPAILPIDVPEDPMSDPIHSSNNKDGNFAAACRHLDDPHRDGKHSKGEHR